MKLEADRIVAVAEALLEALSEAVAPAARERSEQERGHNMLHRDELTSIRGASWENRRWRDRSVHHEKVALPAASLNQRVAAVHQVNLL